MSEQTLSRGLSGASPVSELDELAYRIYNTGEHPVMRYVRELPFEDTYPANMYHKVIDENSENEKRDGERITDTESNGNTNQEKNTENINDKNIKTKPKNKTKTKPNNKIKTNPKRKNKVKHEIVWSPPAHDYKRKKSKGCGFVKSPGSKSGEDVFNIACPEDREHYLRGVKTHCWSLTCPECCNDTALRMGARVEEQLLSYRYLKEKQNLWPGPLGHWVVSPPQEDMKQRMGYEEDFSAVCNRMKSDLMKFGAFAGAIFFHPWRQKSTKWEWMPHFHGIIYGYIDTDGFKEANEGWIIKKVHEGQEIESIAHTAAYLATHMGIGIVERHPEEIDWDLRFLNYMLPGIADEAKRKPVYETFGEYRIQTNLFRWNDKDTELRAEGRGRMCGEINLDWEQWTKDALFKRTRIQYFGECDRNHIRRVATEKERRTRFCKECGKPLQLYDSLCACGGKPVEYEFANEIKTFSKDYDRVQNALEKLRPKMKEENAKVGDISPNVALIVSRDEILQNKNTDGKEKNIDGNEKNTDSNEKNNAEEKRRLKKHKPRIRRNIHPIRKIIFQRRVLPVLFYHNTVANQNPFSQRRKSKKKIEGLETPVFKVYFFFIKKYAPAPRAATATAIPPAIRPMFIPGESSLPLSLTVKFACVIDLSSK